MIQIEDKRDCCGCWACYNICPKLCIEMREDEEGFRYPFVDESLCVNCGLCEKVCPIVYAEKEDIPHEQQGFLVQHKDESIRRKSTSGGAFTAIASWVIRQGGIVFGAGYQGNSFVVSHQSIREEQDLELFRNSKYVQSTIGDTFKQARAYLQKGLWVCFSGTPCQIEGLRSFLRGKEYEKLICVDVVCRGVPSPLVFRKYIEAQESTIGGRFTNILFRDKFYGYHYSSFSIYNEDKAKDYHKGIDSNAYLRAFFDNLSDRPSCYDCRFKKRYRKSDFTLWDCFSVENFTRVLDAKGTTRVLVQSEKGRAIMEEIAKDLRMERVEPDQLVQNVREMFLSVPINHRRADFFKDIQVMPAEYFFTKWFPLTWKVRLNSFVRITCHKLGIYILAKRIFLLFYTRRDERRS